MKIQLSILLTLLTLAAAKAAPDIQFFSPKDYQVFQRTSATEGHVLFSGAFTEAMPVPVEIVISEGAESTDIGTVAAGELNFQFPVKVPAGGWYTYLVQAKSGDKIIAETNIAHVGVGEVFVIAGQSNSANHGAEKLKTQTGKVATFDGTRWQLSADPQPGASGGGGSFIPPFGDAMVEKLGVPVGIISTGVGATSVREWLPKGTAISNPPTLTGNVTERPDGAWESNGSLFENFTARLKPLGKNGFRAVLWHQGESDANQRDATRTLSGALYQEYMAQLINESRVNVGWDFPWFVALASYHTPDDPGSPDLRAGQSALWKNGTALEGPDTDELTGDNRDNNGQGVHFSEKGQRAHAAAWVEKVAPWLAPTKVFILAGQSNMEGQGVVDMDHPDHYNGGKGNLVWSMEHSASKEKMKHLRDADGKWVVRDDVNISFKAKDNVRKGGLTIGYTGYGGSSHIGPELQIGHVLGNHFDEPVLLIKTAWGGKSLQKDFRPPSSGGDTGLYYQQMIAEIRDALTEVPDYELCGFIWMQGWNDMISKEATAEYADNLVNFAKDIRAEFDSPTLPFIIGELGNGGPAKEDSDMQAFRNVQKSGTEKIKNAVFVPTTDFARPAELSPNKGHGHHWFGNAESYFLIGDALGRAAVAFEK